MHIEKRKGDDPIPENINEILNESQRLALARLNLSGWLLQFVRRLLFDEPALILHNHIENRGGILDTFGCVKKQGNIKLRPQLSNKWKLKRLFNVNPLICLLAGLTTIFYFGTPAGYGVGALLLMAALWALMLRSVRRAFMNRIE